MLVVLDTNVLVSGLIKRNSKPGKIFDAIIHSKIQLIIDQRIFQEYQDVLYRPKFNFLKKQIDPVLRFIAFSSEWIECDPIDFSHFEVIDNGDLPFAELAIKKNTILITGNTKHFQFLKYFDIQVMQPGDFLSKYFQQNL